MNIETPDLDRRDFLSIRVFCFRQGLPTGGDIVAFDRHRFANEQITNSLISSSDHSLASVQGNHQESIENLESELSTMFVDAWAEHEARKDAEREDIAERLFRKIDGRRHSQSVEPPNRQLDERIDGQGAVGYLQRVGNEDSRITSANNAGSNEDDTGAQSSCANANVESAVCEASESVAAKPTRSSNPRKKRGRRSNLAMDNALKAEYSDGLESGQWDSIADFARKKGKERSTISKALTRARLSESLHRH